MPSSQGVRPHHTRGRRGVEQTTTQRGRSLRVEELESREVPSGTNLSITDSADATVHHIGDAVTYFLTVTNNGASLPVGTPITVTDILGGGLVDVSATAAGDWSFGLSSSTSPTVLTATYAGTDTVAAGAILTAFTVTATVGATAPATLGNAAFISSPGNQNLSDSAANTNVTILPAVGPTVAQTNSINPSADSDNTATTVTITGTGFTGATQVMFGTVPATSFTVNSDTQITAVSPGNVADATINITVTTPAGTSATNPADEFTNAQFLNNPTLTLTAEGAGLQVGQAGNLVAQVTTRGLVSGPGSIAFNATLPTGVTEASAAGVGWTSTVVSGTTLRATYNGPYPVASGTALPPLVIPLTPTATAGASVSVSASAAAPISIDAFPQPFSFPVSPGTSPPPPDLTVSSPVVVNANYSAGDVVDFDFTVSNASTAGPVSAQNSITLTTLLPPGLTGVTASGTNWALTSSSSIDGSTIVTLTYTGTYPIAAGAQLPIVTVSGTLATPIPQGTYTAVAIAATPADTDPANNSAAATIDVVGGLASTITTLSSSATAPNVGLPITFTATVTNSQESGTVVTTGIVSFYDGSTILGTANVNSQGQATLTTSTLAIGSHTILAAYTPASGSTLSASSDSITQLVGTSIVAIGAGLGGGTVQVDNTAGTVQFTLTPFGASWTGGVRVATGDLTGNGVDDIIVAAGPGGGPRVAIYDGATGDELASFYAFAPSFTGGVFVAAADLTGRRGDDIIVGAGAGGGPQVMVFQYAAGVVTQEASFYAFAPTFTGGVTVAGLPGTPLAQPDFIIAGQNPPPPTPSFGPGSIVVGAGAGGGPAVAVFQYSAGVVTQTASFFAFAPSFLGGVSVANATGLIAVGAGPGGGPQVAEFTPTGFSEASFYAFSPSFSGGVEVGSPEGSALLYAATGPGIAPQVVAYDSTGQQGETITPFTAAFLGGLFVG